MAMPRLVRQSFGQEITRGNELGEVDAGDATLYAQAAGLRLAIQGGRLFAQAGGLSTAPGGTVVGSGSGVPATL